MQKIDDTKSFNSLSNFLKCLFMVGVLGGMLLWPSSRVFADCVEEHVIGKNNS